MAKILLVEDNEMNRDMLSRRLQRRGHEVVVAVDGGQGVELARSEGPDIILMDMSLPVLDGWEASRPIKAAAETSASPIIALTAHAMSGDRDRAIEAGCDDYDTKPVELGRLLDKIDALLKQAGSDKSRILSATIWLTDMRYFPEMNAKWDAWLPAGAAPARATVQAALATPNLKVEIGIVAAAD